MCKKNVLTIIVAAILVLAIGQVQAATVTVDVPNGDFETIYKPNSTTVTATISSGGWTQGVGPACPIDSGSYTFSDQTTGSTADITGWVGYDRAGWIALGGTYGRDETTGNLQGSVSTGSNHTTGGANCYLANGGSWGNSAGGLIVTENSVGKVLAGATYTLSMYAKGAANPVALKLLADGVEITPSSSVSPTLSSSFQEFTRTYDYDDLTSYIGQDLTIVCGVDRNATGTQTQMDDITLEYTSSCPADLTMPPVTGGDGLVLTDASSIDTQSAGIVTNTGEGVGGTDSTTVDDGEYIDILDSGYFQLGKDGNDFALSFWLKATGPTQIIGTNTQYNNNQGFIVFVDSNSKIGVKSGDGTNGRTVTSSKAIQLNEWTHVVINYTNDGDASKFEVNVDLAETSGSAFGNVYNSNLRIGDQGWGTISSFDVCIFQSWSRLLTRNETKALYFDKAGDLGLSPAALSLVMSELMDHMDGTATLSGAAIEALTEDFIDNAKFLGRDLAVMSEAFTLVDYYETNVGPLFINQETLGGFPRVQSGSDGYELERAIFTIQQEIHDRVFDSENCQSCQVLLKDKIFETSDFFPGACDQPANPETYYNVSINGTNPAMWGKPVCYGPIPARRPTGCYLAPGSIGTVTVPSAIVNQGFEILVGTHAVDKFKYYKPNLLRLDRVSKSFPITSTVTTIANPLGGSVYIMVPYEADFGSQTVQIKNVVRSPYYAATSTKQTTLQQWTNTERNYPGPWADFETDKFMMTVPTSWIYNYADPASQLADWDLAMDAESELIGYRYPHNVRNLPVLYVQIDTDIQHGAYGTGYPQINHGFNPYAATDGNQNHFWLRDVMGWSTEFHELSHCQLFSKFPGHEESMVNLPYVYIASEMFDVPLVDAFTNSMILANLENVTVDQAALMWFVTENFRNGNPMDITNTEYNEVRYQHRGYGRYVDIAGLFGWDVLSDFYYQEHMDYMDPPDSDGLDYTDSRILRLSKAAGVDLTPLIHAWGVHPVNASQLKAAIEAENLPPSKLIYERLVHYKDIIPADNDEFWDHYTTIYPSEPTGGNPLYQWGWYNVWKYIYDTDEGTAAKDAMQDIIDLYFPDGYSIIYEMEDGVLSGAQIASNNAGYTGSGFADYINSSNDYVEVTVNSPYGGSYDLSFRYALAAGNRPLEIKVNGQVVSSSLSFPYTGSWTTWGYTATVSVTLDAGDNTVRATAIGSSGANVDHLLVE